MTSRQALREHTSAPKVYDARLTPEKLPEQGLSMKCNLLNSRSGGLANPAR